MTRRSAEVRKGVREHRPAVPSMFGVQRSAFDVSPHILPSMLSINYQPSAIN
jgi:hypothetical protein